MSKKTPPRGRPPEGPETLCACGCGVLAGIGNRIHSDDHDGAWITKNCYVRARNAAAYKRRKRSCRRCGVGGLVHPQQVCDGCREAAGR